MGSQTRREFLKAIGLAALTHICAGCQKRTEPAKADNLKLYWFIPDGMRADPELFDIYKWADEGKLPNIKRMMEMGSYGFCKPTFPSHTPTNFATLFTGAYPEIHGVNDGPMHTQGNPLDRVSVGGFSSAAKRVAPIWVTLEKEANLYITLLSIPGSTPPELEKGITIRGRWGGWGAEFHAVNFQEKEDLSTRKKQGRGSRLFFFGPQLTQYVERRSASGWKKMPSSSSPPMEAEMTAWGATVYAYIYNSADTDEAKYDTVVFSWNKKDALVTLKEGQWSNWLPITLKWKIPNKDLQRDVETLFKIKVIKLGDTGFFRVRFFYNNINKYLTRPQYIADELVKAVGPMVDFVDNFPPQLVYYPEDKGTFLEEADMSLNWHRDAVSFVLEKYLPDIFIHDVYTPNQMLTGRWWMGYIDPSSARYNDISEQEREKLWEEVKWLYKKLDDIIGRVLKHADENTIIVLTSDHGAVPLDRWVRLNNLFAKEGLLKFKIDQETGEPIIDWNETKAIYLKMDNVYVNPDGLGGKWERVSGPAYEKLRQRVKDLLLNLRDRSGIKPVAKVVRWEEAQNHFRLLDERVGDLVIANRPGYGWNEEMTQDLEIFSVPLKSGYKQAIIAEDVKGMWAPFVILGPGIKKGNYLGEKPIEMVDQYPTIMHLLGVETPEFVQGSIIKDALEAV